MGLAKQKRPGAVAGYRGKQAKTGNSLGFRFDKALFQSHPEFSGEVRAHVIAPGRMLVIAESSAKKRREHDTVMEAFLSFLAADIAQSPEQIKALDRRLMKRIGNLTRDVRSNPHEDLGDVPLL